MNKTFEVVVLFITSVILIVVVPLMIRKGTTDTYKNAQAEYELEYFLWELTNYGVVDATEMPAGEIHIYCYTSGMEFDSELELGIKIDVSKWKYVIVELNRYGNPIRRGGYIDVIR